MEDTPETNMGKVQKIKTMLSGDKPYFSLVCEMLALDHNVSLPRFSCF